MLHSKHTLNHLVLTKMYQLKDYLNKVKHNRTSHIWLNQTFCTGFHHKDLTRKYQDCTHIKLRNKFRDFWSVLSTEWTFLPGLTNFTTDDNQALSFKISASTKKAHLYHLLYGFNLGALTHLLPLICFGKSLKYLQNSKQLDWIQSGLCDSRDSISPIPRKSFISHRLQKGSNTPSLQGTSGQIQTGHVISNNICKLNILHSHPQEKKSGKISHVSTDVPGRKSLQ